MAKNQNSKIKNQNFGNKFADWFEEIENLENIDLPKETSNPLQKKGTQRTKIKRKISEKPVPKILKNKKNEADRSSRFLFWQNNSLNKNINKPKVLTKDEFLKQNQNVEKIALEKKIKARRQWEKRVGIKNNNLQEKIKDTSRVKNNKENDFQNICSTTTKKEYNENAFLNYTQELKKRLEDEKKDDNFNLKKQSFVLDKNELRNESRNKNQNLRKQRNFTLAKKSENSKNFQNYLGTNKHFVSRTANNFSSRFCETFDGISQTIQNVSFSFKDLFSFQRSELLFHNKIKQNFAILSLIFVLGFAFFSFVGNTFAVKENVINAGEKAKDDLKLAANSILDKDFQSSKENFENAYNQMNIASQEIGKINELIIYVSEFFPKTSQLSSGKNVIEAGKYLTHAGTEANDLIEMADNLMNKKDLTLNEISWLQLYQDSMKHFSIIYDDIEKANNHINKVNLNDLPENYRTKFVLAKEMLPTVKESLTLTVNGQKAIEDLLGANGPRTYLFLFQNNHEMRATGGFIGSYGLIEISNGKITQFKIDGIFNPDGQLIDRIVPPLPIQKISADWSLHDSNWFPNFPTSAEKAIDFYERTGGQTVDGVITVTPTIMREILKITGPIKLTDYNLEINSENFMEKIQTEVEINYDKDENDPKKILSDLTPLVFKKILENKNPKNIAQIANVFINSLNEKQILIYSRNNFIEDIVRKNGWSGEIIKTDKDYLSVINTNINGFKSDGMINETIEHSAEIFEDGSIIDTITITREHNGGKTNFSWWDAVNSDYMRIYVPKGSELLSVEGQTREINEERLDYDKLNYERDKDVENERKNTKVDDKSGTKIYEENDKTVFANWVYVSPQEKVKVTYKYLLPFKVKFEQDETNRFGSYAVLYQKQSGSENSKVKSSINLPKSFEINWKTNSESNDSTLEKNLQTDVYHGIVFKVK